MEKQCPKCPNERLHGLQFQRLREDLGELKSRVADLEQTLTRGMVLLIANLTGVVVTLGRELMR